MRIGDWSSDVGSSDLIDIRDFVASTQEGAASALSEILSDALVRDIGIARDEVLEVAENYPGVSEAIGRFYRALSDLRRLPEQVASGLSGAPGSVAPLHAPLDRSEEHTSELQSLMRISYAVFCLKKKKKIPTQNTSKISITK